MHDETKKLYLIIESALLALTAGLLAAAAVRMYVHGAAQIASGDLFYYIYTREKVGAALLHLLPLICATAVFTVAGWVLGIRDESAGKLAAMDGIDVKESVKKAVPKKTGRRERILQSTILILAIVLILLGIWNGGMDEVFDKGAAICTECVGLG